MIPIKPGYSLPAASVVFALNPKLFRRIALLSAYLDKDFAIFYLYRIDPDVILARNAYCPARLDIKTALMQGALYQAIFDDESF